MRTSVGLWVAVALCSLPAAAADGEPTQVIIDVVPGASPAAIEALVERAVAGASGTSVQAVLRTPDGLIPVERVLPVPRPMPDEPPLSGGMPVDHPGRSDGALSGKSIYLSQCHGWIWYEKQGQFNTQRGLVHDTVEDFHNPEALNQYLAPYLENAGASVYTVKERDINPRMALAGNDGDGYSEQGDWRDGEAGFLERDSYLYGENPFDLGGTRRAPANSGAVATWMPEVPADGWYAIYVSWDAADDHAPDALYRIRHPGGVIERRFDQRVHGSTWQYVENLWLPAGVEGLTVELVADSAFPDSWVSADTVRVGGGTALIERFGQTTGRPRWEEGAILSNQFNGVPLQVYDPYNDGDGADVSGRPRWAKWEHPKGEDAVFLSWHSNAFKGESRGTSTYTYASGSVVGVPGSVDLAGHVQDQMITSFRTFWDADWQDRGLRTANVGEVNPSHNDEMPGALVELAFHDNVDDVAYIKDPRFRRDASRAMLRGIVEYFAQADGSTALFLPEPPVDLAFLNQPDGLELSWSPGPVGEPYGDAADTYVVYTSADGRSWDNGVAVSGTSTVLDAPLDRALHVRVAAANGGGTSFASEAMSGRRSADGTTPVLVVGAFDRESASLLDWEDKGSVGVARKLDVHALNPHDVTTVHGRSIDAMGWPYDSASDEAFDRMDLSTYGLVIWAAGEESTVDDTFSALQQRALRDFVDGGGALWVSGAEVLWDLDFKGSDDDRAFALDVLGASLAADDAGTTEAVGTGLLGGLVLDFGREHGAPYPVEWPDVLSSQRAVVASYGNGGAAAVLDDGVLTMGFPFECVGSDSARHELTKRVLHELLPGYEPPTAGQAGGEVGCACRQAPTGGGWLLWLVAVGALLMRRRQAEL